MLTDEPIQSAADDLLSRSALIERLAALLRSSELSGSVVAGVHGPWGTGKSSVLHLLEEKLTPDGDVVVWFRPWFYSTAEAMLIGFLERVRAALDDALALTEKSVKGASRKLAKAARQKIKRNGKWLSAITGKDIEAALRSSPDEVRDAIAKASAALDRRVFVMVDDIDRLPPDELLLVLKMVRLCSGFPRFTFVIAFDRNVVTQSLKSVFAGGRSDFVEKMIQVDVPLPPVDELLLREYVAQKLRELCDRESFNGAAPIEAFLRTEHLRSLRRGGVRAAQREAPLFASLREAKRFANSVSATLPLVAHDTHLSDFLALEYLRVVFPTLYEHVYTERYRLAPVWGSGDLSQGVSGFDALKHLLSEEPRRDVASRLLSIVFPEFADTTNNDWSDWEIEAAAPRARSPSYVDRFFSLRVAEGAVSQTEVEELFGSSTIEETQKALVTMAHNSDPDQRLRGLFEAVQLALKRHAEERSEKLIRALIGLADPLGPRIPGLRYGHSDLMPISETLHAWLMGLDIERRREETASIVAKTTRVEIAIVFTWMAKPTRTYRPTLQGVDLERMEESLATRLGNTFIEGKKDLIAAFPNDWFYIVQLWNRPESVTPWLVAQIRANSSHWESLANRAIIDGNRSVIVDCQRLAGLRMWDVAIAANEVLNEAAPTNWPASVQTFFAHLVAPTRLVAELDEIASAAARIQTKSDITALEIDWATPDWEQYSLAFERWLRSHSSWSRLQGVFTSWSELKAIVNSLTQPAGVGSHDAAAKTRDKAKGLASVLVASAKESGQLVIEALNALPKLSLH